MVSYLDWLPGLKLAEDTTADNVVNHLGTPVDTMYPRKDAEKYTLSDMRAKLMKLESPEPTQEVEYTSNDHGDSSKQDLKIEEDENDSHLHSGICMEAVEGSTDPCIRTDESTANNDVGSTAHEDVCSTVHDHVSSRTDSEEWDGCSDTTDDDSSDSDFEENEPSQNLSDGEEHSNRNASKRRRVDQVGGFAKIDDENGIKNAEQQTRDPVEVSSKTRGKKRKSSGKTSASRNKKKGSQPSQYDEEIYNVISLYRGNVITSYQNNDASEDQPTFAEGITSKEEAIRDMRKKFGEKYVNDANKLRKALSTFTPNGSCKSDGQGRWIVRGMRTSLDSFQVIGAGRMKQIERRPPNQGPRGGILADEMGMGKTLMCLAVFINSRLSKYDEDGSISAKHRKQLPTLIVVPPKILKEWETAIDLHLKSDLGSNDELQWLSWSAGSHITTHRLETLFSHQDIILTTYPQIAKSCPKRLKSHDDATWQYEFETAKETKTSSIFHKMEFHRIILDEAQSIHTHDTHISLACRLLMARHRWAVSATPVYNRLDEFYAILKFLGHEEGALREFKKKYCNKADRIGGAKRLLKDMQSIMIKRTHGDSFMGARLLVLPLPDQWSSYSTMSTLERKFYDMVGHRFTARFRLLEEAREDAKKSGKKIQKKDDRRRYELAIVMILRLRQLAIHPLFIQDCLTYLQEPEDLLMLHGLLNETTEDETGKAMIAQLKRMLTDSGKFECLEPIDEQDSEIFDSPQFQSSSEEREDDELCLFCFNPLNEAVDSSCGHQYCFRCNQFLWLRAMKKGDASVPCRCEGCDGTLPKMNPLDRPSGPKMDTKKAKGEKVLDVVKHWFDSEGKIILSHKLRNVRDLIEQFLHEDETTKIIVNSNFLVIVKILAIACFEKGWEYIEYTGKESSKKGDEVIDRFKTNSDCRIMLASLKTASLGLNLTIASKVIICEPYWNSFLEQQAFGRTFRRGQKKKTELVRMITKDSIDVKISEIQQRKDAEINPVMIPDEGREKLTDIEIEELFSVIKGRRQK